MEEFRELDNIVGPAVDFGPVEDKSKDIIKVIGVGGGGCNAVNNMYNEGIESVTFAVVNTDSKALKSSPVPVKVPIGEGGLGAGADPAIGRQAAQESIDQIHRLLDDGTKMCFVTAGMGGGTGTGAAPVIAGEAKSMGILTIGIVTIPFYFEKRKKILKALRGVEQLRKNVDALLIINNERISDIFTNSEVTVKEAFKRADQILSDATKSISELITVEGDINLDFKDVETTLRAGGGAIMAMGRAEGEHRVEKAVIDALDSPLLYGNDIDSATRILFNIYTSNTHPLRVNEMNEIDRFMDALNPNIDVIWGVSDDNTLGEAAKVTILATGFEDKFTPKDNASDDDSYLESLISQLYTPYKKDLILEKLEGKEENIAVETEKNEDIKNPEFKDSVEEVAVASSEETAVTSIEDSIENSVEAIENTEDTIENSVETIENTEEAIENSEETIDNTKETAANSEEAIHVLEIEHIEEKKEEITVETNEEVTVESKEDETTDAKPSDFVFEKAKTIDREFSNGIEFTITTNEEEPASIESEEGDLEEETEIQENTLDETAVEQEENFEETEEEQEEILEETIVEQEDNFEETEEEQEEISEETEVEQEDNFEESSIVSFVDDTESDDEVEETNTQETDAQEEEESEEKLSDEELEEREFERLLELERLEQIEKKKREEEEAQRRLEEQRQLEARNAQQPQKHKKLSFVERAKFLMSKITELTQDPD